MNQFLFSLTTMVMIILVVNEMTPITEAIFCTEDFCKGVECPSLTPQDCQNKSDGRYRFVQNGGTCGCCPFCVRVFAKGEDCSQTLIQPRMAGTSLRSECEQGTRCDGTTLKCV